MKKVIKYTTIILSLAVIVGACQQDELAKKKEQLKEYKSEVLELNTQIESLEKEIASLDPEFAKANRQATLVTTLPIEKDKFQHFVEASGSVESRKNITLSAETMGNIKNIYVKEGQDVRRGQLLLKLDDEILRNNINEVETNLELATSVFQKRKNLWEKNIGTEVQYLEAKNAKESLQNKLATLRSQLKQANVTAPFSGSIDKVFVREGEMAQPGSPMIRMISLSNMYIDVELSEAFVGKFKAGQPAIVTFPSLNKEFESKISAVSKVIDVNNRTFSIEIELPQTDYMVKPNMISVVKLKDFEKDNAVIVPTNLIQMDKHGDYIYVLQNSDNLNIAKKIKIEKGKTYKNKTLVEEGLSGDELLIDEGFREVTDGTVVQEVESTI
jgi:membrane fusion protein, multidrug efflux system